MPRPSAARQKLADFQQQLAALSNAQTKTQEQLDQVRSQLQNPNSEIKPLQPGIAAGLALQEDERSKRFLMGFGELSVPKIRPGDGHWLKHSLAMQHIDLDPEATQRGIAARQAQQDRLNAVEEARQQRLNQQEQERRNAMVSDRPSAIA